MRIRAPLATYALFFISKIAPATARITSGKGQRRQIDNCHGICCTKLRIIEEILYVTVFSVHL